MNIWSLNRHDSIKHLLLLLRADIDLSNLRFIDREAEDMQAIYLTGSSFESARLYIYTYGQSEDRYGVHIEYPDHNETAYSDTIVFPEQYSNVITSRVRYYVWQFKESPQQAAFALEDHKKAMKHMKSNLMNPTPRVMTDDRRYF